MYQYTILNTRTAAKFSLGYTARIKTKKYEKEKNRKKFMTLGNFIKGVLRSVKTVQKDVKKLRNQISQT